MAGRHARPRAASTQSGDTTGSIGASQRHRHGEADWRAPPTPWANATGPIPSDPQTAIALRQALRATGQRAQAVAVLEQASMRNPKDMEVLGAYGRALADVGNYEQALDVLGRAHTPDRPDWHILSAQGAVLDQMGRHEDAQRYYRAALKIVPDEPSVLSNLGLSYALSKDLPRAEAMLRARRGAAGRSARAAESRAGGRADRAVSPRPRRSHAPTCRPRRPPPMSPICGRCCRGKRLARDQARRPRTAGHS